MSHRTLMRKKSKSNGTRDGARTGRPLLIGLHSADAVSIARRYLAGENVADIAEDHGICITTAVKVALREGCPQRPVGRPRKKVVRR